MEIIIIFKLQIQKTRLFPLRYLKSYLQPSPENNGGKLVKHETFSCYKKM